jgi:hypothetical protein
MKRHKAKRRRIRTIIQEVINITFILARHARNIILNFGKFSHNFALPLNIQNSLRNTVLRC